MASHPAAPLLAADLGRLPHTNNRGERGIVQIPGFMSNAGMSEEQSADVGLLGLAIAEGVIEDLQGHGYPLIHESEIAARVEALASMEPDQPDVAEVRCNVCREVVFRLNLTTDVLINTGKLGAALSEHAKVCNQ